MSWAPWKWRGGGKRPPKADLGKDLDMYFNKELNRWVERGKEEKYRKEAEETAAPPKCGPASGPASYTLERTSLQNRYVLTPGLSSAKAAGRETPPPSFGSLIPKANGKSPAANIFVPPRPEAKAEADDAKEPTTASNDGASDGSMEMETESNGGAETEVGAVGSRMGRRSRSLGDALYSTDKVDMRRAFNGDDGTPEKGDSDASKRRITQDGGSPSFSDKQGTAAEGDTVMAGAGSRLDEEGQAESGLPEAGSLSDAEGGGEGLDESDAHSWIGRDMTRGLEDDMAAINDGEGAKDGAEATSANQEAPDAEEDFTWIHGGWGEDEWQNLYAWLDEAYKRENWSMWSLEDWNQFWKWYQQANYANYEQQGGQVVGGNEEVVGEVPRVVETDGMQEDLPNNNSLSSQQELTSLAFGAGLDSGNDQSGYVADSPCRSQHTQSLDSPGAVLSTEIGNVPGVSPTYKTGSLEDGPVQVSLESGQTGAHALGTESDASATPVIASSPEFGVFEGDGQVLKKISKMKGPMPWDEESDEYDSMAGAVPNDIDPASANLDAQGEIKKRMVLEGDGNEMASSSLAPISIGRQTTAVKSRQFADKKEVDVWLGLPGFDDISEEGHTTAAVADLQGSQSAEHTFVSNRSLQQAPTAVDLCPNEVQDSARNVSGVAEEKQQHSDNPDIRTAEAAVQQQDLDNLTALNAPGNGELMANDSSKYADDHVGSVQEQKPGDIVEKINGRITSMQPLNGLSVGAQLNGTDVGAMLLELRALLDYVDPCDDGVLERKAKAQNQLTHLISTLNLGDHAPKTNTLNSGDHVSKTKKEVPPPSVPVEEHTDLEPVVEDVPKVEAKKVARDISGIQDDMDDMALALGLESRKVSILKQECERNGIDADAILDAVEARFGIEKDNFQDEASTSTSPSDEMTVADISSNFNSLSNDQTSKLNGDPPHLALQSTEPMQHLGLPANHDTGWHLDGVI